MIKCINHNKVLVISHIADIDGAGSIVLANKYYNNIDYILCEIKDLYDIFVKEDLDEYELIYVCDLSPNMDVIDVIDSKYNNVKIFDHHLSTLEYNKDYITCIIEENGIKTCATEVFYKYLLSLDNKLDNIFYKEYVEDTRKQDTWDFNGNDYNAKALAYIHALLGPTSYINLINSLDDTTCFKVPKVYDELYKLDIEKQKSYVDFANKNLLITKYMDYTVGVCVCEEYRSIVGNEICLLRDSIDFALIINFARNSVSLRCAKDNIDLNVIAKSFHHMGGGHKKAAGFTIDEESIPKVKVLLDEYLNNIK